MWELPGGGREGEETPLNAYKEVFEGLGLKLESGYSLRLGLSGMPDPDKTSIFMVGTITQEKFAGIVFGDEGRDLSDRWMSYQMKKGCSRYRTG